MNYARTLAKWLAPAAALFALACALLAPVEAGSVRRPRARAQNTNAQALGEKREEPPADSTVRGRVVYDDTSRPVRRGADGRVQKYLTGATIIALAGLRTDDRGTCRLTGLPPGEYRAVAFRRPALTGAYEQEVRRLAPAAPRVALREGETSQLEVAAPDN